MGGYRCRPMRLALALCACGAVALQPARTQQHRRCDPLASTASRPPRTGRGRAAKFIASREAEASYAARLRGLLRWEREAEERAAKQRLEEWSDARLLDEGVAVVGLSATRLPRATLFGRPVVRLELPRARGDRAPPPLPHHRFAGGDLCLVSERRPSGGGGGGVEGTVLARGPRHVDVVVGSASAADRLASGPPLRLDMYFSGVSYDRMDAAVDALTSGSSGYLDARRLNADDDVVLELRRALVRDDRDEVVALATARAGGLCRKAPSEGAARAAVRAATAHAPLDAAQAAAAAGAIGRRLSLIQGPPGTGKTRTAAAALAAAVVLRDSERGRAPRGFSTRRALACAASNVAADNLLEALLALNVSAVRVGHPAATRETLRPACLDAKLAALAREQGLDLNKPGVRDELQREALLAADVVVTTTVGAGCDALAPFLVDARGKKPPPPLDFGLVLLDEAAQATEPACLVPVACARACSQVVLVGDDRQLPPTVLSREAAAGGLPVSLFQRLADAGVPPALLTTQYRMHPALNRFSSERFYGGLVKTHGAVARERASRPPPAGIDWPNRNKPIAILPVPAPAGSSGNEERESDQAKTSAGGASFLNKPELDALVGVVASLLATSDLRAEDIGVITPYAAQRRAIADALAAGGGGAVEVNTVDAYQGREKDVIIISTVRSNARRTLGFVRDDRRMNVALTRARRAVVLVGDPATLREDDTWRTFIHQCTDDGCVLTPPDGAKVPPPILVPAPPLLLGDGDAASSATAQA